MAAGESIYFIGGTFGSGSSTWVVAAITSLVTAFATLGVGYLLESWKRRQDRRALAETFFAEVAVILTLLDELQIERHYRDLRDWLQQQEPLASWSGSSSEALTFPVTIYEKCADRIGTLGQEPAADIVRFYNALNGIRTSIRIAISSDAVPNAGRIKIINFMLGTIATERPRGQELLKKLRVIADGRGAL